MGRGEEGGDEEKKAERKKSSGLGDPAGVQAGRMG